MPKSRARRTQFGRSACNQCRNCGAVAASFDPPAYTLDSRRNGIDYNRARAVVDAQRSLCVKLSQMRRNLSGKRIYDRVSRAGPTRKCRLALVSHSSRYPPTWSQSAQRYRRAGCQFSQGERKRNIPSPKIRRLDLISAHCDRGSNRLLCDRQQEIRRRPRQSLIDSMVDHLAISTAHCLLPRNRSKSRILEELRASVLVFCTAGGQGR